MIYGSVGLAPCGPRFRDSRGSVRSASRFREGGGSVFGTAAVRFSSRLNRWRGAQLAGFAATKGCSRFACASVLPQTIRFAAIQKFDNWGNGGDRKGGWPSFHQTCSESFRKHDVGKKRGTSTWPRRADIVIPPLCIPFFPHHLV